MTTAAAQAQALANGLAQSSKSIADSTKSTSQYFDSFVKRLKEVDATFNNSTFSKTLNALGGKSRETEASTKAISKLANEYRALQASVTGGIAPALTEINNALSNTTALTPAQIAEVNKELKTLTSLSTQAQSQLSVAVSQSLKLRSLITASLTDTSDVAGSKIKNLAVSSVKNFDTYKTGLTSLGVSLSAEAQRIETDIRTLANAIKTTQSSDVENLKQMIMSLDALQQSFQTEMDKSKTVVTQFTSQADLVAASLQRIRDNDPTNTLTSTIGSFEDLVQTARDKSKQLLVNVAEDRFKQLRDISFRLIDEIRGSLFGQLYGVVKTQLDAFQKGFEVFASNVGTRSILFAQGLKAAFQGGGTVATTVQAMATLGRLNFKAGTDELTKSAAMAVKMAEALGISGDSSAHIVFYTKQAGINLDVMGDTLATIRENTRFTADEFGRFTQELGEALMIMGNISNYAEVMKNTLKIDDTLRQFTGRSGEYVDFFKRMATTSSGMQMSMALGMNPENLGSAAEQQRFLSSFGAYIDTITKNQPFLQQIAILEDLSTETGLSVIALRNLSKAAAELNSRTDQNISLDQRYANEVANLGKSLSSISESLHKLLAAGMWPLVTALSYVADGVAWLLAKLRGINGVFETLAFVGGVVAVGAVGLLVATIKQLAMWAPIAAAGVRALATQLMATTTGAAVSGAMRSAAETGASTGLGAILMNFLVNPLKLVFMPVVKTLAALLTPLGLLVVAVGALAAYFLKKDIDTIREIKKINEDNDSARSRDAQTIRGGAIRRTSEARGASIQTVAGLSDAERLKTLYIEGSKGQQINFGEMVEKRNKDIASMMNMGEAGSITPLQAAQFKNEMAQRDVVYLRNAIAAQQSRLVTESRPPTKEETDQLALLTSMVKYLEEQVRITQKDSDDQQKRRDEQEQLEQLTRTQSLEWGPMMY